MANLQITLPGSRKESTVGSQSSPSDKINIDLDNQSAGGGRAISWALFEKIVSKFHAQVKLRPNEKASYVIDKQLLHILMASTKCTSLLLSKCLRNDGEESIAFVALDKNGKPIGVTINRESHEVSLT